MYVKITFCFQEDVKELKTCAIEHAHVNNKYTKTRCEISLNLTMKTKTPT